MIELNFSELPKSDVIVNFDMDGVIADWVDMYIQRYGKEMPLDLFNELPKEEKLKIKNEIFDYDFFYNMKPIEKGMELLNHVISKGYNVKILSAYGDTDNVKIIEQAKRDWVKKHIGDIPCEFVDKVENKHIKMDLTVNHNVLIDDRQKAIDAWVENDGIGLLFVEE